MKNLLCLNTLFFFLFTISSAQAEEVLIVRWYAGATADMHFENKLKKLKPNVRFRYIDANRDKNHLVRTVKNYDFSKVDLVYTFGTTATKIVKGYLAEKKPLVFNMVSAPVLSGIANSIKKPGNNLTGVKLLVDLEEQISVLAKIRGIRKLGVWFDPREKQSLFVLRKLKSIAVSRGMKLVLFRIIPDTPNFDRMLKRASLNSQMVDAVYFIASGSFINNYKKIQKEMPPRVLTMGLLNGVTVAMAVDLEVVREMAAIRGDNILDSQRAGDIPIGLVTKKNATLYVRPSRAKAAGLKNLEGLGMKIRRLESWKAR